MNTAPLKPSAHSRQSSQSSLRPASGYALDRETGTGYVQHLRMSQATVWASSGPRDAVSDTRKTKMSSAMKKGRFGMKLFQASAGQAGTKPSKIKLRLYAAPEHTTLVPRLSASEANDNDEDDFKNFTSVAPSAVKSGNTPSIARSSLHLTMSRNHSFHTHPSGPPSPAVMPARQDSVASSTAASSMRDSDALFSATAAHRRSLSQSQLAFPSGNISRPGSPTQLQQYTTQHHGHIESDDEDGDDLTFRLESRPRLFIANADAESDSE